VDKGFLKLNDTGKHFLTDQGKSIGGEYRPSQYGGYFYGMKIRRSNPSIIQKRKFPSL